MKVLQVLSCAYRATIEEQDDTILWLTQAMRASGGELDVLLTGEAANYAITGHDASGFAVARWKQTEPPRIDADIARMLDKGIKVLAIDEDVCERGLRRDNIASGVHLINRSEIAARMNDYDLIWRW